jgi:hypothetical protein
MMQGASLVVVVSALSGCAWLGRLSMAEIKYRTDPPSHHLQEATVSLALRSGASADEIEAVVVITRAAGQPRIRAEDVEAALLNGEGKPIPPVSRPEGLLVEAGGSLGMSANATYRFLLNGRTPSALVVRYGGRELRFAIERE